VFLAFLDYGLPMSELIRTGTAAEILGTSRQHVVDLVTRGLLQSHGAGAHRRIERQDVERLLESTSTRDQRRSRWLHAAVAGRLAQDPERVVERARGNLRRLQATHARRNPWLARWARLLAGDPEAILAVLTDDSAEARELRQNSPFAGVLTEPERSRALAAFRRVDRVPGS
jgi:excisionase family DNA binding protein